MTSYKFKYILSVVIYGTIGYFLHYVKYGSEIVVLFRGVLGSLFILLFTKFKGIKLSKDKIKKDLKHLIFGGISLGINWIFLFEAYRISTVALGSLCNYMAPIVLIILSTFLYNEQLSIKKLLCVIGAFIGIVLVSGIFETNVKVNTQGIICGLLAAVGFVLLIIENRKLKYVGVYEKVIVELIVSAMTVLPYVIIKNIGINYEFDLLSILLILLLGIFHTGFAYCLYFGSINDIPVSSMAILGYIEPALSVIISILILKEGMSLFGVIGAFLILFSACMSEIVK